MTNRPENFCVADTEEYKELQEDCQELHKFCDEIWDSFEEIEIVYSTKKTTLFKMPTKDCKKLAEALGAVFNGIGEDE